jgi:hypothetical protein
MWYNFDKLLGNARLKPWKWQDDGIFGQFILLPDSSERRMPAEWSVDV